MSLRSSTEPSPSSGGELPAFDAWFIPFTDVATEERELGQRDACAAKSAGRLPDNEARRLRRVIEAAIGDVFGIPRGHLATQSRGKAPVALARQAAMYVAHVSCGLSLTEVGHVFARDRTTVAHACAVIEDRRDDPVFDQALELMGWAVPVLVGRWRHVGRDF